MCFRVIADQAERSLQEHQQRLNKKEGDLRLLEERCARQDERINDLQRAIRIKEEDVVHLRGTINAIDSEKDALQITVDEKTERIAELEQDSIDKVRIFR